jgi:hypothetical protein
MPASRMLEPIQVMATAVGPNAPFAAPHRPVIGGRGPVRGPDAFGRVIDQGGKGVGSLFEKTPDPF